MTNTPRRRLFGLFLALALIALPKTGNAYFSCGYIPDLGKYGCWWDNEPNGCSGISSYCGFYCSSHGGVTDFICDDEYGTGGCVCAN